MLGSDYNYAVIGEPSREYFWILSREKSLDKKILDTIFVKMDQLGFDKNKLIWTKQK